MKGVLFPDVCLAWSVEREHQHSHGRKTHLLPFLHKREEKDTLCNRKGREEGGGGERRIKGKGKMKRRRLGDGHKGREEMIGTN